MKNVGDYAIVYDISSDIERNKIEKILKGYGFRIQKSVFECKLSKSDKQELISKLKKLNIKTGFVKIYRLEFQTKPEIIGEQSRKNLDENAAFIF